MGVKVISFKKISFFTIIVTYILIVFGGYVASSESGMGCGPEWPLCNGEVIPVLQDETLIEFAHRFIGLLLALSTVVLFFQVKKEKVNKSVLTASKWMMFLLAIQILAGAVVVVLDLPAIVVTIHLLVAMIFLFTLLWIYRGDEHATFQARISYKISRAIVKHVNRLLILLGATLGLGAYIKHQSYGLACSWLDCRDSVLPVSIPELLQSLHRLFAVVVIIYLFYISYLAFAQRWEGNLKKKFVLASLIGVLQIMVGILTIMTNIPISWAVIHLAVGTLLFLIVADIRACLGTASKSH